MLILIFEEMSCLQLLVKFLFKLILVSGGNSCLINFHDRLDNKITDLLVPNNRVKIISHPKINERKIASWVGASILASTSAFQNLWISKFEYEDVGDNIIYRKCLA